ncbi:MAG: hypothetical protein SFW09_04015 [Hyphomicrobiaceae bacterium]|nr:hypothetical protein [Hyphomicrobiaceae bacterium]
MIVTARKLANASRLRPCQSELRRAVSTAYYALFLSLAKDSADLLVGAGRDRPEKAWSQVHRSLQHGDAKSACHQARNLGFPHEIKICCAIFIELQEMRHRADYDPDYRLSRAVALQAVDMAERAIRSLRAAPRLDRKAFAVLLLFKRRS